jgi:hypothetical protein
VKSGQFGLRIIRIVPRDPYPIRDVGKVKGRLIGWIELENRPIPLDNILYLFCLFRILKKFGM